MNFKPLPHMEVVYTALMSGKHLSSEDGDVYYALRDNTEDYQAYFSAIGMDLIADARGFYYLVGTRAPANMAPILFFTAVLMEHYDEAGYAIETLVTGDPIYYRDLPHVEHPRHAETMERIGVTTADGLRAIVKSMARYGFVAYVGEDSFRFRPGAYRLLDATRDAMNYVASNEAEASAEPAEEPGEAEGGE